MTSASFTPPSKPPTPVGEDEEASPADFTFDEMLFQSPYKSNFFQSDLLESSPSQYFKSPVALPPANASDDAQDRSARSACGSALRGSAKLSASLASTFNSPSCRKLKLAAVTTPPPTKRMVRKPSADTQNTTIGAEEQHQSKLPKTPQQLIQERIKNEPGTESFLSFVHMLSPLVELKTAEVNSPFEEMKYLPTPSPDHPSTSRKTAYYRVAQKLDFEEQLSVPHQDLGTVVPLKHDTAPQSNFARNDGDSSEDLTLPCIEASFRKAPGSAQREQIKRGTSMTVQLSGVGSNKGRFIENINANIGKGFTPNKRQKVTETIFSPNAGSSSSHQKKNTTPSHHNHIAIVSSKNNQKQVAGYLSPIGYIPPQRKPQVKTEEVHQTPQVKQMHSIMHNSSHQMDPNRINHLRPTSATSSSRHRPISCSSPGIRLRGFQSPTFFKLNPTGTTTPPLSVLPPAINPHTPLSTKKKSKCRCKKSKCLKLYCECFAGGNICNGECGCLSCANTGKIEDEGLRQGAMHQILARNPMAFRPKFEKDKMKTPQHHAGCNCKKSACTKKYCECFQAGVLCGSMCKCTECRNHATGGSASSHHHHSTLKKRQTQDRKKTSSVFSPK